MKLANFSKWAFLPVLALAFALPFFVRGIKDRQIIDTHASATAPTVTKKAIVLIYNPILENQGNKRLNQYRGWYNPQDLTPQILDFMPQASHNYLGYEITEQKEIDAFPVKQDGFQYTDDSYIGCLNNHATCHQPDTIDYAKIFADQNICQKGVDEVWLWGGPWFGTYEFTPLNYCGKTMFVMGFNYERGPGEMIHDFGHRMEYVGIHKVGEGDGSWKQDEANEWNKFSLIAGHCGNIHYTPGSTVGQDEYNYTRTANVTTACDGYYNYPDLPQPKTYNCSAWGCTDLGYYKWWLQQIPSRGGASQVNGKIIYNNWWRYFAFYDDPQPQQVELPGAIITPTPTLYPTPVVNHDPNNAGSTTTSVCSDRNVTTTVITTVEDPDGYQDLRFVTLMLNSLPNRDFTSSPKGGALLEYDTISKNFTLYTSNGASKLPFGVYKNDYINFNAAESSVTGTGNQLTIKWVFTALPTWENENAGVYLDARDMAMHGLGEYKLISNLKIPCDTETAPKNLTWNITAQAVCNNNIIVNQPVQVQYAFWPPNPLTWLKDTPKIGAHSISLTSTKGENSMYMMMVDANSAAMQPISVSPSNPGFDLAKFFNPLTWMVRWNRNVPEGAYTIKYQAPSAWCTIPPTPTNTPQSWNISNMLANLGNTSASFNFTYTGTPSNYFRVHLSTTPDMSSDVYLTFAGGTTSPLVENNPHKWDKYTCGKTLYWRVETANGNVSPIAQALVCPSPTPTPKVNKAPIAKISLPTITRLRVRYAGTVSAYDPDYTDTVSAVISGLPQGLEYDCSRPTKTSISCNVKGVAKKTQISNIKITITDSAGGKTQSSQLLFVSF